MCVDICYVVVVVDIVSDVGVVLVVGFVAMFTVFVVGRVAVNVGRHGIYVVVNMRVVCVRVVTGVVTFRCYVADGGYSGVVVIDCDGGGVVVGCCVGCVYCCFAIVCRCRGGYMSWCGRCRCYCQRC